jgi:hypothetical protein
MCRNMPSVNECGAECLELKGEIIKVADVHNEQLPYCNLTMYKSCYQMKKNRESDSLFRDVGTYTLDT